MNKVLVVVDMQVDFISGSLGTQEAAAIVQDVVRRIQAAKADGDMVMFTMDTHADDYLSTAEGKLLPVTHCVKGSDGWKLAECIAVEITPDMQVFEKSIFGSNELVNALKGLAERTCSRDGAGMEIELCGLCTDICVVTNALLIKTALPEAQIIVNSSLCAGVTPVKHAAALETMSSCQILII